MKSFVIVLVLLLAVCAGSLLISRPSSKTPEESARLQLVATIFPIADWLREVGGPGVDVHLLVSGAANPHHFEPTMKDALRISEARAVFAVGLGLDPWAEKLWSNSGRGDKTAFFTTSKWISPRHFGNETTISVAAPIPATAASGPHTGDDDDEHHEIGDADPHYWLDPLRAQTVVLHMGEELAKLDPPHRDGYIQRAQAYAEKLKALNSDLELQTHDIPTGKKAVTFHDAYGYLLERLGAKIAAVVQVSPGVEPSPRNVAEALRTMREIGQKTVFTEPMDNASVATTLAGELGGDVQLLDPMDSELSDAGKTYLERLRTDIGVLANALKTKSKAN